ESGVYGNLHLIASHPHAAAVMEAAEKFPTMFGLSHNASGASHKQGTRTIVESVDKVRSVDLVGNPATNQSLFESEDPVNGMKSLKTRAADIVSMNDLSDSWKIKKLSSLIEEMVGSPGATDSQDATADTAAEDAAVEQFLALLNSDLPIGDKMTQCQSIFSDFAIGRGGDQPDGVAAKGSAQMSESYNGRPGRTNRRSHALMESGTDRDASVQAMRRRYR
ncbi:MAG: hypothetical protein JWN70_6390, partial [Planctomycetaceae bacterium]|nr:hypothetical protein [Planctomycetaceae bacterium]